MYTSIVVGTDGSDTARVAVDRAADLARRVGARLHLVRAHDARAAAPVPAGGGTDLAGELGHLQDELAGLGIAVDHEVREGDAAEVLLDVARTHDADLVVVGCRGMQGPRRLLGSVPNDVAHRAPCTVLVADTSGDATWPGPVVVGVDDSATAATALRHAAALATVLGQPLHVVSAYRPVDLSQLPTEVRSSATPSGVVDALLADLASTAATVGASPVVTHPRTGDPADAITGVARAEQAAVAVVGNRGMRGARRLLGSVPNKVAHHAPCSTLIVHTV